MKMLPARLFSLLALLAAASLPAAPGEVTVALEKSPDQSAWSGIAFPSGATSVIVDVTTPQYLRASIVPADGGTPGTSEIVLAAPANAGKAVSVALERSPDLADWGPDAPGTHDVSGGRKFFRVQTDFDHFVDVPGGTLGTTFVPPFIIGAFEVTKEVWDQVYGWAILNGYTFFDADPSNPQNYAVGCNGNHPVAQINWYDVVKWCNARSEKEGLVPVYYTSVTQATPYRTGHLDLTTAEIKGSADGYRLPTRNEWMFAAQGGASSPVYVYSGSNTASDVAIYLPTSVGADCGQGPNLIGTWPVASKAPNFLGTYDMSGNVAEWVWDGPTGNRYIVNGGYNSLEVEVGIYSSANTIASISQPFWGFRLARNFAMPPPPPPPPPPPASVILSPSSTSSGKGQAKNLKVK